jgi:hypothetical protein
VPADLPPSELDTYLLRDSKGNLVPVIGWSFEDFETLLKIRRGLQPPPPPPYSLDSLAVTGKADGAAADLQVTVVTRVREAGWVKVPLRFDQAAVLESPKYQGPGEYVLGGTEADKGNVLWLKGEGKSHQLQMRVAVPVIDASGERRLALTLPRATESQVRVQVPLANVVASLRSGSEGILTTKSAGNKQTDLQVVGAAGELQLTWQASRGAALAGKPALEASGEIFVRVESRSRLSAEARLKLRSLGKPLDTVQIRLPPTWHATGHRANHGIHANCDGADVRRSQYEGASGLAGRGAIRSTNAGPRGCALAGRAGNTADGRCAGAARTV